MEEPKKVAAGSQSMGSPQNQSEEILDLTQADSELPTPGVGPRVTVRRGYRAESTIEGGDVLKTVALGQKLPTPLATALVLADVPGDPRALLGIPTLEITPSRLKVDWDEIGETFACNVRRLFTLKKITVPERTRMVIHLEPWQHEKYGTCVKLWWDEESFVPIVPRPRSEKKKENKENKESKPATEEKK